MQFTEDGFAIGNYKAPKQNINILLHRSVVYVNVIFSAGVINGQKPFVMELQEGKIFV